MTKSKVNKYSVLTKIKYHFWGLSSHYVLWFF
nr:MAG TPA_asm: hypothetical protein [Caudoviricetes sp.]